jgi:hypothetical protein
MRSRQCKACALGADRDVDLLWMMPVWPVTARVLLAASPAARIRRSHQEISDAAEVSRSMDTDLELFDPKSFRGVRAANDYY